MSVIKMLAAEMAKALDDLYSGEHSIDYVFEYEDAAGFVLAGPLLAELRRKNQADAWDEGAEWAFLDEGRGVDAETRESLRAVNPYRGA